MAKPSVKATFSPSAGVLSVSGDDADNVIVTSRDAAGQILVNGGAVPVAGGTPTVANTSVIEVFGNGGNDTITVDEANGALPAAHLFGGAGNDVLTGGSGSDLLEGGDGVDTAEVNGGNGSETFTITANGTRVRFDRISPAPFTLDIGTTENLVLNANGGDDVITAGNGLANLI